MRRNAVVYAVSLVFVVLLSTVPVGPIAAQNAPTIPIELPTDRTVLPIPEPHRPHSPVLDARHATPPQVRGRSSSMTRKWPQEGSNIHRP